MFALSSIPVDPFQAPDRFPAQTEPMSAQVDLHRKKDKQLVNRQSIRAQRCRLSEHPMRAMFPQRNGTVFRQKTPSLTHH